jgi:hypothetical protein
MRHPSTKAVFDYWNAQRGTRAAPERADIDPIAIRHALGDTFMLAVDFVDELRFRLAGTRVCALFCREIKGETFAGLWNETSSDLIQELLGIVTSENVGAVAGLRGRAADGDVVERELLLLPLAHSGHARVRALGVLVPARPPYWLGEKPVAELELTTLRHIGQEVPGEQDAPEFGRRVPKGGRLRHGFVVYSGGREEPDERVG